MNIIFFGTPEIAAYCLQTIHKSNHKVLAVVTSPDKPAGRGKKIQSSAVKQYAEKNNLPVLQPSNLKSDEFEQQLRDLNPDLAVVVAFRMLPQKVWALPKLGTINLHASLLPNYRGAAPINHVIINGEKETGITTFFINEKIDTGNILLQEKIEITQTETAGTLHDKIMYQGAKLILKTLEMIEKGQIKSIPQTNLFVNSELHPAPKLTKENTKIQWTNNAENVYNFIRGLSPYPGAWTNIRTEKKDFTAKIIFANYELKQHNLKPGHTKIENKQIKIAVKNGFIILEKIIPQGKKQMDAKDFLNGIRFEKLIFE